MSGSLFGGLDGGYKKFGHKNPQATKYKSTGGSKVHKVEETIEDIQTYPCREIPDRGITKEGAEHFGIRTKLDGKTGLIHEAHYFPYYLDGKLVGYKKRDLTLPKVQTGHFSTIGFQGVACEMFGVHAANKTGNKTIIITEGEYDAVVTWQIMRDNFKGQDGRRINPTVVSISNGTASAVQNLGQKANQRYIGKHASVVLCFDADKADEKEKAKGIMKGKDATAAVYSLMPNIKVADLPDDHDPCDMQAKGMGTQLFWSIMKPIEYVPEGFRTYEQIRAKAHEIPKLGRPWPWLTMTRKTLGRREGEGYFIGAGVKMGKSEWLNQLAEHIFKTEGTKVALFKFEEENEITCKKIAGKLYHKDFTNAEKVMIPQEDGTFRDVWGEEVFEGMRGHFKQEELEAATDAVGDNIIYYSNYGRAVWDEVKGAIRHAVLVEGAKDVFIDPITRLVQGMNASDANTELERFSDEISKMAKELGFTYYCFCHLNKPENGKPHEFGGQVQSAQFAGSRAMMRNTYYMIGIERNKDPDLTPKERNTSYFVLLDDRKHGRSGKFPVFYDIDTGDYLEPPEGFLESECQTLREWYNQHPEDDPTKGDVSVHKKPTFDAMQPLSAENVEGLTKDHYEITQDQIPEAEEEPVQGALNVEATVTEEPVVTEAVEAPVAVVVEKPPVAAAPAPVLDGFDDNDWDSDPPF